jgi:hypothetical protein
MERLSVSRFAVHGQHDSGDNRYPLKGSQHQLIATGAGLLLKYSIVEPVSNLSPEIAQFALRDLILSEIASFFLTPPVPAIPLCQQ